MNLTVRYRVTINFHSVQFFFNTDPYNLGFADIDAADNVIYDLEKYILMRNSLSVKYNFKTTCLSLNARHYWSTAPLPQNT
ncbi:MAG: hypothetical protein IPL22_17855 [Bacteroidetes bacterium]|nr:hypothetical protein [Bacteroidota bacterium]